MHTKPAENVYYNYVAPKRPVIRRLGTIRCDMVEATPIVWKDRLYRFEYYRPGNQNEANPTQQSHFRFVDVQTNAIGKPFGFDHHLGSAYTDGEYMYAVGDRGSWGADTLTIFRSKDLEAWEEFTFTLPGLACYNTGICEMNGTYILLIEVNKPTQFTFRFASSTDLVHWELLPEEQHFQEGRYAGGPAIYTVEGDPHYYVLYLEANPGPNYVNSIARSTDLVHWEYSPINPVLMYDDVLDKQIANPYLTPHERARIERALDINNSDMELCEFLGRTIIYYSWGSQRGIEFLAEAAFEGTKKEFLQGWFGQPRP